MITTATITAFLYAGAIQQGATFDGCVRVYRDLSDYFDKWDGHIGFVASVEQYAQAISDWLKTQPYVCHPGVLEYELIEDLGEWLIVGTTQQPTVADVLARFQTLYTAWIGETE